MACHRAPPKSKGDYVFISHMIETTYTDPSHNGRIGVICPHGVLFRGSSEGKIRPALIEENLLDTVCQRTALDDLPPNLFYGTGIPAAILIFKRNKADESVLFIEASREFERGTNQNQLREADLAKVSETYRQRHSVDKYAYLATLDEIAENAFNLNIPRYVDTFEEEEEMDIRAVQGEMELLEGQLAEEEGKMRGVLEALGL